MVTKKNLSVAEINEINADLSATWTKENDLAIRYATSTRNASLSNTGRKHTQQHKEKIRLANKGRKVSDETREKLSSIHKGRGMGRKHSEEAIEKIRKGNIGRKTSDETKKKLSDLAKERHILKSLQKGK